MRRCELARLDSDLSIFGFVAHVAPLILCMDKSIDGRMFVRSPWRRTDLAARRGLPASIGRLVSQFSRARYPASFTIS